VRERQLSRLTGQAIAARLTPVLRLRKEHQSDGDAHLRTLRPRALLRIVRKAFAKSHHGAARRVCLDCTLPRPFGFFSVSQLCFKLRWFEQSIFIALSERVSQLDRARRTLHAMSGYSQEDYLAYVPPAGAGNEGDGVQQLHEVAHPSYPLESKRTPAKTGLESWLNTNPSDGRYQNASY
jgi:hypothetical protein